MNAHGAGAGAEVEAVADRDGLDVDTYDLRQVTVVAASGTVDAFTAPVLSAAINAAVHAGIFDGLVVDLSEVNFLACAGLSVLLTTSAQLGPGVGFGVVADGQGTVRPMTLLGIDQQIRVYRSLDEALMDLTGP